MAKAKKKPVKKAAKKTAAPSKKKSAVKTPAKKSAKKVAKPTPKKVMAKPKSSPKTRSKAKAPVKFKAPAPNTAKPVQGARGGYSDFVTPLDDRVLVRMKGADRMTAGGLYIPDTVSDVSGNLEGVVVAVGRGHRDKKGRVRPMDLRLGDRVLFGQYAGSKIRLQDEDLVLLRESEVMGVVS